MMARKVYILMVLFTMAFAGPAVFAQEGLTLTDDHYFLADAYITSDAPISESYGGPVGSYGVAKISLPDDLDVSKVQLAVLWLSVDDIDETKEANFFVNDQGPIAPSKDMLGEGIKHDGYLLLNKSLLKPGENEFKFVFEDDLGGSTGGFEILDVRVLLVSQGAAVPKGKLTGSRMMYLDIPEFGNLAVYDKTIGARRMKLAEARDERLGWKKHPVRRGDGKGGWVYESADYKFMHASMGSFIPYGMVVMDNGEVMLAGSCRDDAGREPTVVTWTRDGGDTWDNLHFIRGCYGRPVMTAYLGKGNVGLLAQGRFSKDYGRTWPEKLPVQGASNGNWYGVEGNPMVDYDENGLARLIGEPGFNFGPPGSPISAVNPSNHMIRWSKDGGRTWFKEDSPKEWVWEDRYEGKTHKRSVSEGSLVRAKNGWIVAAMRTDVPAKYIQPYNDNMEGVGVSISKDNGKTWSPLNILFKGGRMQANIMVLANGDLVITYVVRRDVDQNADFVSFRRGFEAVISHDNGKSWELDRKYILDEWEFVGHPASSGLGSGLEGTFCGHTASAVLDSGEILSAYGHYNAQGTVLIRWKP